MALAASERHKVECLYGEGVGVMEIAGRMGLPLNDVKAAVGHLPKVDTKPKKAALCPVMAPTSPFPAPPEPEPVPEPVLMPAEMPPADAADDTKPRCSRRNCPKTAHTRGLCESDYRRTLRMGINGYRDATTARQHVAALRDLGWAWEQIGQAAGLSTWVAHQLHAGTTTSLWPESERALLAVPLRPQASHRGVNSVGTRRRVQALAWMGWTVAEVALRAGTTPSSLRSLIQPKRRISYALAMRVAAVYDELSCTRGRSNFAAGKARDLGFAPPAAWDDDIDNPAAKPRGIRTARTSKEL